MNSLLTDLGIASWKPVLTALLLPPVPFLLLILIGARLLLPRRGLGWFVVVVGVLGIWFCGCNITADWIDRLLLKPPRELSRDRIAELKNDARRSPQGTAIVVLGGGLEPYAPEYGVANLMAPSLERLRFGLWLGRESGLPVAFSGGVGWAGADPGGSTEAEVAGRIAQQEFGRPLRWTETESRDTRENAARTVALLKRSGVQRIVLVTHAYHMPRALRAFTDAARAQDPGLVIEAAPIGLARRLERTELDWMPGTLGSTRVRNTLREWLGLNFGS